MMSSIYLWIAVFPAAAITAIAYRRRFGPGAIGYFRFYTLPAATVLFCGIFSIAAILWNGAGPSEMTAAGGGRLTMILAGLALALLLLAVDRFVGLRR